MSTLCDSFQGMARTIGRMLPDSYRFNIRIGEETLTDLLLYMLMESHPSQLAVHKFTRHAERKSGADWEWALGGYGGWFRMRVQAKKLNPERERFESLMPYRGNQRTRQVNSLLRHARTDGLYPAYCFYATHVNGTPARSPCACDGRLELMGCMIADAKLVRQLILRRQVSHSAVASISMPLHCLVCCTQQSPNLATRARGLSVRLRSASLPPHFEDSEEPDHPDADHVQPHIGRSGGADRGFDQLRVPDHLVERAGGTWQEASPEDTVPPIEKEPPPYFDLIQKSKTGARTSELDVICAKRKLAGLLMISEGQ